ncbi:PREDICTED: tubulin delta chain-like [Vollenhovia emeryi]|uniref:tubulin delta chain-like n=1 Tax=Vollenhovia emeryi TaxID=411798 RepID=UPI0005F40C1A|nr:PREDICTED: tubulin delta chain-like [Vollenhovia emeryi]XP_011866178.1 PREDICTED: tubulin delta chain-like [Vollenhovia emeryi]XP_011866179.1 PREDICTED: tubulin delta chain-like [Vollenhovia emeryi]XP_011866180.1 PREDICTED: tubulin delta chain-like [Vollenhovia emeryi]
MLTLQFGQCGNQLGRELFSKVAADLGSSNTGVPYGMNYEYAEDTIERWFDGIAGCGRHYAKAILVDTEEKVVSGVCKDAGASWVYQTGNVVCQAGGGSANNWAYGYAMSGRCLSHAVLNVARQEIEKLDRSQGFLLLLSSAGGTGSGVGSRVVELLREEYETKAIIAAIVLPFTFGEVCTQNYNTVLTLAKFSDRADLSVLFENERMHSICTNLLGNSNATLRDVNSIISENLLAVFQPSDNARCSANFLISKTAAHPNFRFVTVRSTPHTPASSLQYEPTHKWEVYIRHLKETLRVSRSQAELTNVQLKAPNPTLSKTITCSPHLYSPCVSNVLITRGRSTENDVVTLEDLQERRLYPEWTVVNSFTHLHQERRFLNRDKFLALVSNNSEIHRPLDVYLDKAWGSYKCAAFLHQYEQFGLEEDDFLQAFAKAENIVHEYKNLKGHNKN